MRNLKRVLSLALACVMVIGMMVMTTGAADIVDIDEVKNVEAVEVMAALGVLEGDENGVFNPKGILTREQAAKIICYMLMGPDKAEKLVGTSAFSDVEATRWSAPYIAYCASLDIISGYDGKFNPTGELTDVAFGKMLLVALGYDAEIEGYVNNDNWATNIGTDMVEAGINDGAVAGIAVTRESAAQMAFQTLTADLVKYEGGMDITTNDTTIKVGAERENIALANGKDYRAVAGDRDAITQFCEKYFPALKLDTTANTIVDDFGRQASVWFFNDSDAAEAYTAITDAVASFNVTAKTLLTYTGDLSKVTEQSLYKALGYEVATITVLENGAAGTDTASDKDDTTAAFATHNGTKVEIIDNDGNGIADTAIVTYGLLAQVTKVNDATDTTKRSVELKVFDDTTGEAYTGANAWETEDFAKDDIVVVYVNHAIGAGITAGTDDIMAVEAAECVTGKITKTDDVSGDITNLYVADTAYPVGSQDYMGLSAAEVSASSFTLGTQDYNLWLVNGYVMGVTAVQGGNVDKVLNDTIVYATETSWMTVAADGTRTYYVRAVKMDGTLVVLSTTDRTGADVDEVGFYTIGKNTQTGEMTFADTVDAATTAPAKGSFGLLATGYSGADVTATGNETSLDTDAAKTSGGTTNSAYVTDNTITLYVSIANNKVTLNKANAGLDKGIKLFDYVDGSTGDVQSTLIVSRDDSYNYHVDVVLVTTGLPNASGSDFIYFVNNTADGTKYINQNTGTVNLYKGYTLTGEEITVAAASLTSAGWYDSYTIDADGVYTLSSAYSPTATKNNDKGLWTVTAQALTNAYGYVSVEIGAYDVVAAPTADDLVITNIITAGNAGYGVNTLDGLAKLTNFTGFVNVDKDGVVTHIFVTAATAAS